MLKRYLYEKDLTYLDVFIIIQHILPKDIYNDWPSVNIKPPLDIPYLIAFNNHLAMEWYYFNANVTLVYNNEVYRSYILRVLKRTRINYDGGDETLPWLLNDEISLVMVPLNSSQKKIHLQYSVCAPCVSKNNINKVFLNKNEPYYLYEGEYNHFNITLIKPSHKPVEILEVSKDTLKSKFNSEGLRNWLNSRREINLSGSAIEFEIQAKSNKKILLQGPKLDGLDPSSQDIISKISGSSYLYFSWPSWIVGKFIVVFKGNTTKKFISNTKDYLGNLWLDHQGGVVKQSSYPLITKLSIILGLRPRLMPGWNWFSLQIMKGKYKNQQFTGYSNKPRDNKVKYHHQQLKGTWSHTDGTLEWVYGDSNITKFWQNSNGINYGIQYIFNIKGKGTFHLKAISYSQITSAEGIQTYEGGCEIYDSKDNYIGVGNIECIGWGSIEDTIDFASSQLTVPLKEDEKANIYKKLYITTADIIQTIFYIILIIILSIYLYKLK